MTAGAALESDVFRLYVAIIAGLLLVAGATLALLRWGLRKNVGPIVRTYRAWLIIVPLVLAALVAGRVGVILGLTLLALFAFKEFARATGLYDDWWMTGGVYVAILALGLVTVMMDPRTGEPGWYGMFMALPVYAVGLLLTIPILRNRIRGQLQEISLAILGFVYLGWMFGHLAFLANARHALGYLLYLLFAVEVNDIAAFTFGRTLGRHRLREAISPTKTVEGAVGALAVSLVLPWMLRFSFPHLSGPQLVLTGLIVGIGGQLGDLTISLIKRDLGVKDMGATIPGHGGILDRIDSLIFVAPLFFHTVRWFHDLY